MNQESNSNGQQRGFRFSLMTTLIVFFFVAILTLTSSTVIRHYQKHGQWNTQLNNMGCIPELGTWGQIIGVRRDVGLYPNPTTELNDATIELLAGIKTIRWLNLRDSSVSDEGLELIGDLPKLRLIYLEGTMVSKKGVQALQQRLPKCEIHTHF